MIRTDEKFHSTGNTKGYKIQLHLRGIGFRSMKKWLENSGISYQRGGYVVTLHIFRKEYNLGESFTFTFTTVFSQYIENDVVQQR